MGRLVDVDDLIGARGIAERLGFAGTQGVHYRYRTDDTFPRPVFEMGEDGRYGAKVWVWPDVEEWARESGRPIGTARRS